MKARTKFPNKPPFEFFFSSSYDYVISVRFKMDPDFNELEFSGKYQKVVESLDPSLSHEFHKIDEVPSKEKIAVRSVFSFLKL